jgi:hypothetical protein
MNDGVYSYAIIDDILDISSAGNASVKQAGEYLSEVTKKKPGTSVPLACA